MSDKGASAIVLANIVRLQEVLSSIVLAVMMVLTFVDVIGRYVFTAPIFGASEMIATLLALLIFAGLGVANATDKHIVVELFDARIKALSPRLYEFAVQGLSLAVMCLIVYVLIDAALHAASINSMTYVLELPLDLVIGAVAVLAILCVVTQVLGLIVVATNSQAKTKPKAKATDQGPGPT